MEGAPPARLSAEPAAEGQSDAGRSADAGLLGVDAGGVARVVLDFLAGGALRAVVF